MNAALSDEDYDSESCGVLNSDFEVLKVVWENGLVHALLDLSMKVDKCCPQESVACCVVEARVNDEKETWYANDAHANL
jgi:hypothetical protein